MNENNGVRRNKKDKKEKRCTREIYGDWRIWEGRRKWKNIGKNKKEWKSEMRE